MSRVKLAVLIRRCGFFIRSLGERLIACSYRVQYRNEDDDDDADLSLVDLSLDAYGPDLPKDAR
jgi:hypothetical protein